jgi:hypothetical protein
VGRSDGIPSAELDSPAAGVDIRCAGPKVDVAMMLSCLLGRPTLSPWRHRQARCHLQGVSVGAAPRHSLLGRLVRVRCGQELFVLARTPSDGR